MKPMTGDELKAAFAALPPMGPVEPEHSWRFWAWDLRQNVANNDPSLFLTWPGVVGTMFVGDAPYIKDECNALPLNWYMNLLYDPEFGKTKLDYSYCTNLAHQAYHICQISNDVFIPELETIVEIGGGYGAMALVCHRLGFRGRYVILDLPEFSLLQQYYLSNVGVDNVEFLTQIDKPIEADLLIGLYSLSEMPLAARDTIIELCPADGYLLAYGASWGGWDNMAWASRMMKHKGFNWKHWNIPHLPNSWYLVGSKKE